MVRSLLYKAVVDLLKLDVFGKSYLNSPRYIITFKHGNIWHIFMPIFWYALQLFWKLWANYVI